ncbi:hypothetical protein [Streptomyces sp. NPDC050564]|uniref:hypothetical protein n=1 Tax=Streptomyces sp. NPDC050564 TaxID=3365631 RepID=UPI00379CE18F
MRTALTLLRASVEGLQDKDLLMTDCRGEPLDEVLQRHTEWTVAAQQLAAKLGKAYSAVGDLAYKEAPDEQGPATRG